MTVCGAAIPLTKDVSPSDGSFSTQGSMGKPMVLKFSNSSFRRKDCLEQPGAAVASMIKARSHTFQRIMFHPVRSDHGAIVRTAARGLSAQTLRELLSYR